jgi:hypothetical protein
VRAMRALAAGDCGYSGVVFVPYPHAAEQQAHGLGLDFYERCRFWQCPSECRGATSVRRQRRAARGLMMAIVWRGSVHAV